jgi:hypothetical protein
MAAARDCTKVPLHGQHGACQRFQTAGNSADTTDPNGVSDGCVLRVSVRAKTAKADVIGFSQMQQGSVSATDSLGGTFGARVRAEGKTMKTYQPEVLLGIPVGLLALAIFSSSLAQTSVEAKHATSTEVESNFRGRSFQLIGDGKVAIVRALDWPKDRSASLPFWLDEVKREARRRDVDITILPTDAAIKELGKNPAKTNAILHVTC